MSYVWLWAWNLVLDLQPETRILNNLEATEKLNLEIIGARSHANVSLIGATHLNIGVIQDYLHGKDTSRKQLGNGSRTPDRTQNARHNMTPFGSLSNLGHKRIYIVINRRLYCVCLLCPLFLINFSAIKSPVQTRVDDYFHVNLKYKSTLPTACCLSRRITSSTIKKVSHASQSATAKVMD